MAKSVNKVTLLGNLGQEPELRTTPTGLTVCKISVATSESYKDKSTDEWKETTEWHNVVLWDRLGQRAGDMLKKGSKVYIEGKIQTRSYDGKDGVKRYVTEIIASNMIPLSERPAGSGGGYDQGYSANKGGFDQGYSAPAKNDFVQDSPSLADHLAVDTSYDDEVPF